MEIYTLLGRKIKKYNEPALFNPPKKLLVTEYLIDFDFSKPLGRLSINTDFEDKNYTFTGFSVHTVWAIQPNTLKVYCIDTDKIFNSCFEVIETMATYRELALWLLGGKGLVKNIRTQRISTSVEFKEVDADKNISKDILVLPKGEKDWVIPTKETLCLENSLYEIISQNGSK